MSTLVLENVSVDFPIYGAQRSFRKALFKRAAGGFVQRDASRPDRVVVKALANVSLSLTDGDRLGLVGHNGAGKSTLLRTMAGIYAPAHGRIFIDGEVTPLFESLPGLDMEDTGYENVITAGLLFGLDRHRIEEMIPDIEQFSELGEYLALPVRTYSSGMVTRLGFALATAMHPGILLMDEGIGAGDARFAERANRRLENFINRSRIVVLASHSQPLIKSMCKKAGLMEAGQLLAIGPVDDIFAQYEALVHRDVECASAP